MNRFEKTISYLNNHQHLDQGLAAFFFGLVIIHIWIPIENKRQMFRLVRNNVFGYAFVGLACWMHWMRTNLENLLARLH